MRYGLEGKKNFNAVRWVPVNLNASGLPSLDEEHLGEVRVTSNGGSAVIPVRYAPDVSAGILGVYTNGSGTDCNFIYDTPGLLSVVVVHTHTQGATAVQFSAPKPDCWTNATYLSDVDVFPVTIGSSQTGKAVGYGTCVSAPIWVTAINYFVQTPPGEPCCIYPVLPDPNVPSGQIEVVDCNNSLVFGRGTYGVVNPDATCWCSAVVRVEETTWGRVKALYAPDEQSN